MTKDEKKAFEEQMDAFYTQPSTTHVLKNTENMIATPDTFGVSDIEISFDDEVNYEQEMINIVEDSTRTLNNMAQMYLEDLPDVLESEYIKDKIKIDANNLANINLLQVIYKRAIVKQIQQVERGDVSPRHYEQLALMGREMRETIKQSTLTTSTMESLYKSIRTDKETRQIATKDENPESSGGLGAQQNITTTASMNNYIEEMKKKALENSKKNS
jgi:hypothetical protein